MAGRRRRYHRAWLRWDLLAGLTTAAVVIPQAVAYASLAGLPVQVGLYVATVPMVAYALLGSSRSLSVSSTSTISILTAGALTEAGAAGDPGRAAATAVLLALLVGGILVAGGLLRLGFLADFISSPVLAGFKAGMGLVIAASQLGKVLGVPVEGDCFGPGGASEQGQPATWVSWLKLLLAVGAAAAIAQTGIAGGSQAVAYAVFAVVGTLGVGAPVVIYFAMGKRSEALLGRLKDWMAHNTAVIMAVLCLVIGVKLLGDALGGLTAGG